MPLGNPVLGFARPRETRLELYEPRLRRAVPVLIAVFVLSITLTAYLHLRDIREDTLAAESAALAFLAKTAAKEVGSRDPSDFAVLEALEGERAVGAMARSHLFENTPLAPKSDIEKSVASAMDAYGLDPPAARIVYTAIGDVLTATAIGPDGQRIVAAMPVDSALQTWWRELSLVAFVLAVTSGLLAIIGAAYSWQARRAGAFDAIYRDVCDRLELGLSEGRSGLWDWDVDLRKIFWSDSMYELLGFEPVEGLLDVEDIDRLLHPDDGKLGDFASEAKGVTGRLVERTVRMRSATDQWVWLRLRGALSNDPQTRHRRVTGIAVDVTEEKLFEQKVRQDDVRLRDAIESLSEAFVLWDRTDRLVLSNSRFQKLHDLPDDLVRPGTTFSDIARRGGQTVVHALSELGRRGDDGARSFEARTFDGRWFAINERRTGDGGYVSVANDVTSLKATVEDLSRSRQDLERRSQELVELAERYAAQSAVAEEANRVKTDFLRNMHHELRTPLNAILGFSDLMRKEVLGPVGHQRYLAYASDIYTSGKQLLDFFEDILRMATLEAGQRELECEAFGLDRLAEHVVTGLKGELEAKGLRLAARLDDDTMIEADRAAVRRILATLLSNAIKFTPAGGRVLVRAHDLGDKVSLTVADTGIGIERDVLPKLGRPFVQAAKHHVASHGGSGLGLSIARSLAELHGGTLRVRSTHGKGTVVMVTMPARQGGPAQMRLRAD